LVSLGWDIIPNDMEKLPFDLLTTRIRENNLLVASGKIPGLSNISNYSTPASDDGQNNSTIPVDPELESPEWIINNGEAELKEKTVKAPAQVADIDPATALEPVKLAKEPKIEQPLKLFEPLIFTKPLTVIEPRPTSKPLSIIKDYQVKKASLTAKKIEVNQEATNLTFIVDGELRYEEFYLDSPSRFVIDLYNAEINGLDNIKGLTNHMVEKIRVGHHSLNSDRVVIELKRDSSIEAAIFSDESRSHLQVSITAKTLKQAKAEPSTEREAVPVKPSLL
jgi:hypothetical protein